MTEILLLIILLIYGGLALFCLCEVIVRSKLFRNFIGNTDKEMRWILDGKGER